MGRALSETYARDPKFYVATYCVHCRAHFPAEEFLWDGTNEKVGVAFAHLIIDQNSTTKHSHRI